MKWIPFKDIMDSIPCAEEFNLVILSEEGTKTIHVCKAKSRAERNKAIKPYIDMDVDQIYTVGGVLKITLS